MIKIEITPKGTDTPHSRICDYSAEMCRKYPWKCCCEFVLVYLLAAEQYYLTPATRIRICSVCSFNIQFCFIEYSVGYVYSCQPSIDTADISMATTFRCISPYNRVAGMWMKPSWVSMLMLSKLGVRKCSHFLKNLVKDLIWMGEREHADFDNKETRIVGNELVKSLSKCFASSKRQNKKKTCWTIYFLTSN